MTMASDLETLRQILVEQPLPDSGAREYAAHHREHRALCAELGPAAAGDVLQQLIIVEQARRSNKVYRKLLPLR